MCNICFRYEIFVSWKRIYSCKFMRINALTHRDSCQRYVHILKCGRKVLYQYIHDNVTPSPVGMDICSLRNALKNCTEYLLTLPYCSRWTCSPSVADTADVFRILLSNNTITRIILWILRQILSQRSKNLFFFFSRFSNPQVSRIMRLNS